MYAFIAAVLCFLRQFARYFDKHFVLISCQVRPILFTLAIFKQMPTQKGKRFSYDEDEQSWGQWTGKSNAAQPNPDEDKKAAEYARWHASTSEYDH